MKFKKLKIKNIRSYQNAEIIFPDGSLLLSGEIGSGKTSILLALEYALFGLQPGQKGNSLLRTGAKFGEVNLEMEIGKDTISIERKLKRTPKGISNEFAAITINGERIESSITEIKSKIISLLGYPPEFVKKNSLLYRYTIYSPQEQMKQIILEDAQTRLNLLRQIFGIDKYRRVRDNLATLLANLKTESRFLQAASAEIEKELVELEQRKSSMDGIVAAINKEQLEFERINLGRKEKEKEREDILSKLEERRKFKEEVEKTKVLLSAKKENIISLSKTKNELTNYLIQSKKNFKQEDYDALVFSLQNTKLKLVSLTNLYAEYAANIGSLENQRVEALKKKERVFSISICPTCLQDVSELHKHNILNETERNLSEISKQQQTLHANFSGIKDELSNFKLQLEKLEQEKLHLEIARSQLQQAEESKTRLEETEKNLNSALSDVQMLEVHIDSLRQKIAEFSSLEIRLKNKEEELRKFFNEEKKSEIALAEIKKELEFAKREISQAEESIAKKQENRKKLQQLNEMTDWLSSKFLNLVELIERNVLLRLRAEFSSLFRKWFLLLVNEGGLDSRIDENFTPVIIQGEAELDYDFLSGGERTAIALSYRLALNQIINSLLSRIKTRGIIILDEPTEGFSEQQVEKIRDLLEELNAEQIILVSHEQKIEGFVDNVLRVVKDKNSSSIESDQKT